MSIQDDHFDIEDYLNRQVASHKKGTAERRDATAIRQAYRRVWNSFVEVETENEQLVPIVGAVTTVVRHVIDKHYKT
jgi:hypothetical protein